MNRFFWPAKMAWRDSRGSRGNLILFISAAAIGIAALIAINGFGDNLTEAVDAEAKELIGADLVLDSDRPFNSRIRSLFDSIGGTQATRIMFASMALFEPQGVARLSSIRAVDEGIPFYGELTSEPESAASEFRSRQGALVDQALAAELDLSTGDTVVVGARSYPIVGQLVKTNSESNFTSLVNPRIYIPLAGLDTSLVGMGSRVDYEQHIVFESPTDADEIVERHKDAIAELEIDAETIQTTRESWNEGLSNVYRFLGLVAYMALLLGGLGVASAVHVHVKRRLNSVAILRCFGASKSLSIQVFLWQMLMLGLVGVALGALIGFAIQLILPTVLADFIPLDLEFRLPFAPLAFGAAIGLSATLLFSLVPLLEVRNATPINALRSAVQPTKRGVDWVVWVVRLSVIAGLLGLALLQAPDAIVGMAYFGGVVFVLGSIALVSTLVTRLSRLVSRTTFSYPVRQSIANLHRPNNQTLVMLLSIGFGAFLVFTMLLIRGSLLGQINQTEETGRANLILFDIQPDQIDAVQSTLDSVDVPIVESVPLVTMTISEINGVSVRDIREDPDMETSWAHYHEYRSTYRGRMVDSEELIEGDFIGTMDPSDSIIPISIEKDIAGDLDVDVGDEITFNVHGLDVDTRITSVRKVDWNQVRTNFFVVFPEGSINAAPQTWVVMTRTTGPDQRIPLQAGITRAFPNVSSVDLTLILEVVQSVLEKVELVIQFMALFTVITGLIILASAIVNSRMQRTEESALLKTIGASRSVVNRIMTYEYLTLGVLATIVGLLLSVIASFLLTRFVFVTTFSLPWLPVLLTTLAIPAATLIIGLATSRRTYSQPALSVLRHQV